MFWHPHLRLLLAVYVDDFKMAGPKDNLAKGWELIGSRIDMDTPSPLGRYLGCEHVIKENSRLGTADHPFAHVFDKSIPDPAAKPATAAPVQDFADYLDEEGVYVRYHCQPRKALSAISSVEADAMQLGDLRCTEATAVTVSEIPFSWDTASKSSKLDTLWTGQTYFFNSNMDKHQAAAAVKRIRDKNAAKKQVRQQAVNNLSSNQGCMKKLVNEVVSDMKSFLQQAVERCKDLAGPKFLNLKKVATPFHDDKIARPVETEAEVKGELAPIASRVLMKLLFPARMARYDLLRAVQGLASRVTKRSSECDKALHRLMCYVNSSLDVRLLSDIGGPVDQCKLWLFADADHAGEHDNNSTSGTFLELVGLNTYFPLSAFGKKQTSISISSTAAEAVCANIALRTVGLPSSAIWSLLQEAGGDTAQHSAPKKAPAKLPFKDFPDKMVVESSVPYGRTMIDGRIAQLTEKPKHIPEPVELTTHPLRDVWLLRGDKWDRTEEAVAWEDLGASTYPIPSGVDACFCIYRKSSSDLRRHAEAEATLHRESYALRHSTDDYQYSPKGPEGDSSLILSAPHPIQPVVLEDNQPLSES